MVNEHGQCVPAPCSSCKEWFVRIDKHLTHYNKHNINIDNIPAAVKATKESYWEKGICLEKSPAKMLSQPSNTSRTSEDIGEEEGFLRRSASIKPEGLSALGIEYTPVNSKMLTEKLKDQWNVKNQDYFTIYYDQADSLLNGFYEEMAGSPAIGEKMAMKHRNYVEEIWATLDKDTKVVPVNALSNLHLLRDYYHRSALRKVGKKHVVQASTIRSR